MDQFLKCSVRFLSRLVSFLYELLVFWFWERFLACCLGTGFTVYQKSSSEPNCSLRLLCSESGVCNTDRERKPHTPRLQVSILNVKVVCLNEGREIWEAKTWRHRAHGPKMDSSSKLSTFSTLFYGQLRWQLECWTCDICNYQYST